MILSLSLMILVVLAIFSVILGNIFIGSQVDTVIQNDLLVNGSSTSIGMQADALISIDPFVGLTAAIIVLVLLAIAVGIQIVGSGLSPVTVRIIVLGTAYGGLWILFSLLAQPLIVSIEVFGALIYITLTIGYVWGVIQKVASGGDE